MGGNTALYILRLAGSFDGVVWCLGLPESWPGRPWARWPWARGPGLYIQLFQYPLWVVWEQSSASKTTLDIGRVNGSIKRLLESKEELYLGDVGNLATHQVLDLPTVRLLK